MIRITGDTHGEISRFTEACMPGENQWTNSDILIICGDFGFIFGTTQEKIETENRLLDILAKKPYQIAWCSGNHENFDHLRKYPIQTWNGGKVQFIRPNIIHLMRGQIYSIENKVFFTMGGGYSMDKEWRTGSKEHAEKSWWAEEMPSENEYTEARRNLSLQLAHGNIDYVITHTAPADVIRMFRHYPEPSEAELQNFLSDVYRLTSAGGLKKWYFGHLHDDRTLGKFTCCYYQVHDVNDR